MTGATIPEKAKRATAVMDGNLGTLAPSSVFGHCRKSPFSLHADGDLHKRVAQRKGTSSRSFRTWLRRRSEVGTYRQKLSDGRVKADGARALLGRNILQQAILFVTTNLIFPSPLEPAAIVALGSNAKPSLLSPVGIVVMSLPDFASTIAITLLPQAANNTPSSRSISNGWFFAGHRPLGDG